MRSLIPWSPLESNWFQNLRQELDQTLRRFIPTTEGDGRESLVGIGWAPSIDVEETDNALIVTADLPGIDPKDVDITVSPEGRLIIKGERKEQKEGKEKNYWRSERSFGTFSRTLQLPASVEADNITATTSNGVITLSIPKKAEAQPKKIAVNPQ